MFACSPGSRGGCQRRRARPLQPCATLIYLRYVRCNKNPLKSADVLYNNLQSAANVRQMWLIFWLFCDLTHSKKLHVLRKVAQKWRESCTSCPCLWKVAWRYGVESWQFIQRLRIHTQALMHIHTAAAKAVKCIHSLAHTHTHISALISILKRNSTGLTFSTCQSAFVSVIDS